jgi:hypothetical protein
VWSNADEVQAFIEAHKDERWRVGDRFVLPDIDQAYEVVAVRPFKRRGKFLLFVDLEAACAIEGCGNYLLVSKEVHQWMSSPYLSRCCPEHRFQFNTPMQNAWKTQDQLVELKAKVAAPVVKAPRVGPNERAVFDAIEHLSLVSDTERLTALIEYAAGLLPPGDPGKRDTRKQSVVRALNGLVRQGRVQVAEGRVLL